MVVSILEFIKNTNGDVLGVILFIMILFYLFRISPTIHSDCHSDKFVCNNNYNAYEIILIIGCCIAVVVDLNTTIKTYNLMNSKKNINTMIPKKIA